MNCEGVYGEDRRDQTIQHEPVAEAADTPATHRCPVCGAPKSRLQLGVMT
jgi:rubredoxin